MPQSTRPTSFPPVTRYRISPARAFAHVTIKAETNLDSKTKRTLEQKLSAIQENERRKLYKRATTIRKNSLPDATSESLDDIVLRLLIDDEATTDAAEAETATGDVTWVGRKTCRLTDIECELNGHRVAVGDIVSYEPETLRLKSVLPRKSLLSRPDPGNPNIEMPIVANVDIVLIVVSVKSPPLHVRIIDRYLIAIQRSGAQAALCVNKLDLVSADERELELAKLLAYADLDLPIIGCSVDTGEGIDKVRELIEGKTVAFVGHSGVGKSSLTNAVVPGLAEITGTVMKGYGRGKHTTTWSSLHDLGNGTRIIDTPGIRSLGIGNISPEELKWHFPEFEGIRCKFSDCSHTHEPDCGVKAAVGGAIKQARYDTYVRLRSG